LGDLDLDDRLRLERAALFFIPSALEICNSHQLSVSKLTGRATTARRDNPALQLAGRQVIGTVFKCKQPIVYDSALRFIRLVNLDLPEDKWLKHSDIVACVFRLKEPEIIAELGIKPQDLASECKLRKEVVDAALKGMRITYSDAYAIWVFLMRVTTGRPELPPTLRDVLTGDQRDFISADLNTRYLAVEKIGKTLPKHSKKSAVDESDNAEYVYNRANLKRAPLSHHPWALTPPFEMKTIPWLETDG
jgi:hypothetical protein